MVAQPPSTSSDATGAFVVDEDDDGARLDVFLTSQPDVALTRSRLKRAIAQGAVRVNGTVATKAGQRVRSGDVVEADPLLEEAGPAPVPQDLPLRVLYEDDDLVVLDKAAGMVVHPATGHPDGTLVNALLHRFGALAEPGSRAGRPGIVHRLDKDTSGVMVACRTTRAFHHLAAQFAAHDIERRYRALAFAGQLADVGTFDTVHRRHDRDRLRFTSRGSQGRRAVTHYRVVERFAAGLAVVLCVLETGRTHQIRVHLADAGAPILGDTLYGGAQCASTLIDRQALHAELLGFEHPDGRHLRFECALPHDMVVVLDALRDA